jgi:GT2 family glycosyltransferase
MDDRPEPPRPRIAARSAGYAGWIAAAEPRSFDLDSQRHAATRLEGQPLISVLVPVYRVPLEFLAAALDSLSAQTYPHWEACLACADPDDAEIPRLLAARQQADARVRIVKLDVNDGISAATNAALAAARGEFIALLDHDDLLAPEAFHRMAEAIQATPDADLLYSDKDCIDERGTIRQRPLFKPEWSPEMLYSANYLTHLNLLRRSLVVDLGGFRAHTDGAQDWDIFLRVSEQARSIVRVPGVHYHWRLHAASTSLGGVAAKPYVSNAQHVALQESLDRRELPAEIVPSPESGFQVRFRIPAEAPVHVILEGTAQAPTELGPLVREVAAALAALPIDIPAGAAPEPLRRRLTVLAHADRREAVIAAVSAEGGTPGDVEVEVLDCRPEQVALETQVRTAVARWSARRGAIVFVSGRVAVLREGWLAALVGWVTAHPEIGFATGLVVGADGNVIECGLVVDAKGEGTPLFRGIPPTQWGSFGGPMWYRNTSAANPWALAVKADAWKEADGLDPTLRLDRAFTTLCTRIRGQGYRGVVEPHARVTIGPGPLAPVPPFDSSLGNDPYFHPAYASVVPLRLGSGPEASRARRPRVLRHLPPALVVAGMHRSGTSLVASLVAGAGVSMGTRLLAAGRGNTRGHFEDLDFQEFHQRALRSNGLHGDGLVPAGQPEVPEALEPRARELVAARRVTGKPWGWKDPRTLLFLDFWNEAVPETSWLLVFRSPWEVADSLYRRLDETTTSDPLLAIQAWMHANRLLLDFARRHPGRCLVRELGQVTTDPRRTFAAIRSHLGVPLGKPPACFDPALLGGDSAVIEEQAEIVRTFLPEAEALYHDLRREAGSEVPLPAARRRSQADPRRVAAVAAVTAWARASRTQIHALAAHASAVEAAAARDAAMQTAAAASAAAKEAGDTLTRDAALVRTEAAREVAAVRAEMARDSTAVRAAAEAEIAAARAELSRVTASCADTTRQVLDQEASRTAEIARQRDEIEALLGELHRVHVRLDEATGVAALEPRKRTVDKLRREASRLARQARRIVREQVLGGKQGDRQR